MIDESQLNRLRTAARGLAILSLVVFLGLIGFSIYQLRGIQERVRLAAAKLEETQGQLSQAQQRKTALDQEIAGLETSVAALKEISARAAQKSPELIKQATEETIAANPQAARALPRVYLHIGTESQRSAAEDLAARLQKAGFLVPGVELVQKTPNRSDVRYFHRNEQATSDMQAIVAALDAAGVTAETKPIAGFENVTSSRHYELWLGPEFPKSSGEPPP